MRLPDDTSRDGFYLFAVLTIIGIALGYYLSRVIPHIL